tara:strand:- start:1216 stop:1368 length:153 start_codon:yes stop_codon:yes gene_type:complete
LNEGRVRVEMDLMDRISLWNDETNSRKQQWKQIIDEQIKKSRIVKMLETV